MQLPSRRQVKRVRLLVAGKDVAYQRQGNRLSLEVPSIGLHEVVAVDLA